MRQDAAGEHVRGQGEGFAWTAPPGLEHVALRYQDQLAEMMRAARAWTGLPADPRPFTVEWVGDRRDLARALGVARVPAWYAAVAMPAERRLVIATEVAGASGRLASTARHEIMHLAMADLGPEGWERLPAWFHEGCAEVFADEIYLGEIGVSLSWRAVLGELEHLYEYRDGFPDSPASAAVGYALGERFVRRFARRYGHDALREVLARARAGQDLDAALLELTGLPIVEHEEAMRRELINASGLLGEIYPQIFLGLALIMVLGFPLVRAARRRRRAEFEARWEQQERREQHDPVIASGQWRERKEGAAPAAAGEEPEPWEEWEDEEL